MKTKLIIPILSGILSLASHAGDAPAVLSEQEVRAIGPLPEDKVAETIKKGEYNPFAERQATQIKEENGESEDSKLLTILGRMSVSGIIHDTDGRYKVLFGNRLYSEGDRLQRLLENQTSLIRVSKVTDKAVEFSWVMDSPGATPRKKVIPVRVNKPVIEQLLQVPGEDGKPGGTIRTLLTSSGESLKDDEKAPGAEDKDAIPTTNDSGETLQYNRSARRELPSTRTTHRR